MEDKVLVAIMGPAVVADGKYLDPLLLSVLSVSTFYRQPAEGKDHVPCLREKLH
jgi:hypothetical protein